jgi:alpha-L-rhamnosidase
MLKIANLTTEYEQNPLGLACESPRFSWRFEGDTPFVQKSYRICVASTAALLNSGKADKWDSGEVDSAVCIAVPYAGTPLKSRERCCWQVTAGGITSEISWFEMGLLSPTDWQGEWVSAQVSRIGGSLMFRRAFDVGDKPVVRARAYIAGIGLHEVYVNGQKLGNAVLNPSVTEYTKRVPYCTYAFETQLRPGINALGVLVGNGWAGSRKLLAEIRIDYADGSETFFYTANCADWWVTGAPIVSDSLYDGEVFDGRLKNRLAGWSDPDYFADWSTGWMYVMLAEKPQGLLVPHRLESVEVVERFVPVSVTPHSSGVTIYDMGQLFAGWAAIIVRGTAGARVTLRYGEQLTADGRVNQLNLRTALARDVYILGGEGDERYAPRFTYHGFRYVEAEREGGVEILSLTGEYVRNAVKQIGAFSCADPMLNQLHKNAVYTEGSNLHGVMTDCPQRDERFGWLNDLSSRIYQAVNNFEMPRLFQKVTDDITDTQDAAGRIADTAPFFGGFRPADPVVVCYLLFGYKAYEYYGDKRLLAEHYDAYARWVDFLSRSTGADGATLYSSYGDWCPPQKADPVKTPISHTTPGDFVSIVYYYLHLRYLSDIAHILGKGGAQATYAAMAQKTKKAIDSKYYDESCGVYSTGSQSASALALNCGLLQGDAAKTAARQIVKEIRASGNHVVAGNQAYRHLFEALTAYGYADVVRDVLVNSEYPGWGYMVAMGATTVWERWEAEMQQKMHSFCHPMFASYDAWLFNDVCGLRPAAGACAMDTLHIKPVAPAGLDFARASIEYLRGGASVEWKREWTTIRYTVQIPLNTSARIEIPGMIDCNGLPFTGGVLEVHGGGRYEIVANAAHAPACSGREKKLNAYATEVAEK